MTGRAWWSALICAIALVAALLIGFVAGSPLVAALATLGLAGLGLTVYRRSRPQTPSHRQ